MSTDTDHNAKHGEATILVHGGHERSPHGETSEALYLTSGYVYDNAEAAEARFKGEAEGYVYSRYGNPTVSMFEDRIAALEGAPAARATASGMAAVNASLMGLLEAGDHIISSRALFGSCRYIIEDLLPRYGVASTLIDGCDIDAWRDAVRPETKMFFLETPSNPTLRMIDLDAVSAVAKSADALLVVDNVFATPLLQKPMAHGADIVVYSATKHIDGQGRCLGGVVLAAAELLDGRMKDFFRHTGPSMSPFNAWVMLKGLETLELRVERQCTNAAAIADVLAASGKVSRAIYPGRDDHPDAALVKKQMRAGGTMVALALKGGKRAAFNFLNTLDVIRISNNLGDAKSLATHPATTTHQRLTPEQRGELDICDGLIRISVGIETASDLISDVERALSAA